MADDELSLKEVFEKGLKLFKKVENDDRPSNSQPFQADVCEAIDCFRICVEKVNDLALFSKNEELEDISTNNLRYLLLPIFLGDLNLKLCSKQRSDVVKISKIYVTDFLEKCKTYGLLSKNIEIPENPNRIDNISKKSLESLAKERQAKINRYKQVKEQEQKLKEFTKIFEDSSLQTYDEELQRKYNILLLENWVNKSLEHISSINSELEILEHMEQIKENENTNENSEITENKRPQLPPKPILITRESIKNKVFGAGYPSLPTMTQEEYFEKELREGKIVQEFSEKNKTEEVKDEKEDGNCEDEKYLSQLKKDREWDDWKDDHRRGWGNRENMG